MSKLEIYLKPKEEFRLLRGESFVYSNEIESFEGSLISGQEAYVYSSKKVFIGKGFLNTESKIVVRLLTRKDIDLNKDFFRDLIKSAYESRKDLGFDNAYRLFFSEADGIPGLIIDKYGDYLVIQVTSLGVDLRKHMIVDILVELLNPLGIYERNDVPSRKKEGLELIKGTLYGDVPDEVLIYENDIKLLIDIKNGQKTGTFLDQKHNHFAIKPYVRDKEVLDCFSHIGGFALHAASFGAKHVLALDISKDATDRILANAKLNNLSLEVDTCDVFERLRTFNQEGRKFDVIILDPPAFAKKSDDIKKAYQGYKEINLQAMKMLRPGGYLITCSCSHYMYPDTFLEMLGDATLDSKRRIQMIDFKIQDSDHPVLFSADASLYLKYIVLRVSDFI
ncbi:Ribosomal RNA large subunit methyltransferase I [Acholeplasma oculi]|uniref:SAM-dependent methyltransferaseI n=1 Tax=Acholeplasma oculi TaxID=35623 RepID=A0A061ABV7_9MOLU|nr:class I SAM-dependent rRNA methyltransferase [Acholeplasma oculi]CDR30894.1 SAM-dependent methyltransferaseI [Acholeplasma oculi]SKC35442.1 SAM-dependent methyltransferase [Acholeplasma oculi]SUT90069.1 Ribosomal RNA large subunit methyltransferase I [Acholeplasma oculi]